MRLSIIVSVTRFISAVEQSQKKICKAIECFGKDVHIYAGNLKVQSRTGVAPWAILVRLLLYTTWLVV